MPNPTLSSNLLHLGDKFAAINPSNDGDQVEAVVAILLWDEPGRGLQTLLVQRAEREGDPWSGQIGLPGGQVKQGDETPRAALHREVEEEGGIVCCRRKDRLGLHLSCLDRAASDSRNLALGRNFGDNRVNALHLARLTYLEWRWFSARLARLQMRRCETWFGECSKSEHCSIGREGHARMSQFQLVQNTSKLIPQGLCHIGA